jgi:endonuclease YncB( thermonuclease family)
MRKFLWEDYKNFFAIIIAAIIIGGFLYFGLKNNAQPKIQNVSPTIKIQTPNAPQNLSIQPQIKSDQATNANGATCGASENTIVTKVIDGDTVVVEGGWHVRLLGMDADEIGYPCYEPAKTRLENLVLSKNVVLQKDVSDVDQYGRCLRYIFLGSTNIDTQLVAEGLAVARFYQPDVKYRAEITAAESQAQQNKIGCKWSGAPQTAK